MFTVESVVFFEQIVGRDYALFQIWHLGYYKYVVEENRALYPHLPLYEEDSQAR